MKIQYTYLDTNSNKFVKEPQYLKQMHCKLMEQLNSTTELHGVTALKKDKQRS